MTDHSITYRGMTHQGLVRERNEDCFAHDQSEEGWPYLFMVADGLGGHRNGQLASYTAVHYALPYMRQRLPFENEPEVVKAVLEDTLQKANVKVYTTSLEDPDNSGMGTTLTIAVLYPQSCYVAHIGDSRCYLLRGKVLEALTEDDTYVGRMVASGSLDESEVTTHPRRHILTQALGYPEYIEPHVTHIDLLPKDRYLLSSDGLHGVLTQEAISRTLRRSETPDEAAASLIEQTIEAGAPDNVTAVVVFA